MRTKYLEENEIGLVMITNGRVAQIGLTPEQSAQVKVILSAISQGNPLVIMGEEHDLIRKYNPTIKMERCDLEKNVISFFELKNDITETTEIKTNFAELVELLNFHQQEIVRQINPVKFIDPKKEYPVNYIISQSGEKIYKNQMLKGEDLTEPQIFELFFNGTL